MIKILRGFIKWATLVVTGIIVGCVSCPLLFGYEKHTIRLISPASAQFPEPTIAEIEGSQASEEANTTKSVTKTQSKLPAFTSDQLTTILSTAITGSSMIMVIVLYMSTRGGTLPEKTTYTVKAFPKVIEGVTVYLIVGVVSVLSLADRISPEGTVSILSAIGGYVLGKQTSERKALEDTAGERQLAASARNDDTDDPNSDSPSPPSKTPSGD